MRLINLFDKFILLYALFYLSLFITDYGAISNIIWPTIAFSFLLCARYIIDKQSFSESGLYRIVKKFSSFNDRTLLVAAACALFAQFSFLSIARHFSFSSGASDLGIFDQGVWNTLQGDIFFSSLKHNMNLLGDHFEPILFIFVPLYRLWSTVSWLLLAQSLLLASAVFPLYLIAKSRLNSRLLIFSFVIAYLLSRPLRGIAYSDFHPECFILPLLFWAYYFLLRKKELLFFLSLLALLLCKEDTAFLISAFGIFIFFVQKRKILGLLLFALGLLSWVWLTKFVIPGFNPLARYDYMARLPFGATYQDNILAIIKNPLLLKELFLQGEKIEYLVKIAGPLGFLSFLSPAHLILLAVPILKNLSAGANFSGWYDISSHYTAGVIPFVFIAAIFGSGWLFERMRYKRGLFIGVFVIFISLMFYGKTDAHKFWRFMHTIKESRTLEKIGYLKLIPPRASLSANFNLVPHLSHRKYIFEWNPRNETSLITEYIAVDMSLLKELSRQDMAAISPYLAQVLDSGYKLIFASPDNSFFIYHNPRVDKTLVQRITPQ